ncbi:MAG: hypothetical protein AUJ20_09340 [Comamonadaceae bacterium CG1_02_60_18]|nr:MAG: hypothetical protein AUJ20_09340 [Comamonadaceae bacterium CG1_02_60_18]PIQ53065.1 MAG: hypothetical protein COW02_08270 [Comamonadaceae bacterium CG12_big_fil_rev_8_21_14_0_65_59_15]
MNTTARDELLELSVHSLPDPAQGAAQVGGRLKLLALVLVCSLPFLLAYFAFFVVRPQGEASFGTLIVPAREMPVASAATPQGEQVPLAALKGQWLLVKVDGAACVRDCQKQLVLLRQLRLTLAKDMERVDWVWLINDEAPLDPALHDALRKDKATVLRLAKQSLQQWFTPADAQALTASIFVVDPMGNAMMRFPVQMDTAAAVKARRDLEHLLRASYAWDAPGR